MDETVRIPIMGISELKVGDNIYCKCILIAGTLEFYGNIIKINEYYYISMEISTPLNEYTKIYINTVQNTLTLPKELYYMIFKINKMSEDYIPYEDRVI